MKGYDSVTSRDIAMKAGVSKGLVYKYFPDGKPAILKELGFRVRSDTFKLHKSEVVDFNDFSGFLRDAFATYIIHERKYIPIYCALTMALQSNKKLYSCFEEFLEADRAAMLAFFVQFKGINLNRPGNLGDFIAQWMFVIDATIDHHLLYPNVFTTDDNLIDLLIEISLKLWDYKKTTG